MKIIDKCFGKLQYKFFFMFVLLSLIPIMALTIFTIDIYKSSIKAQTESNAVFQLRALDGTIYEKVKTVQRFSDLVKLNPTVSRAAGAVVRDYISLDSAIKSTVSSCEGIKGAIFFFSDGETYMYNISDSLIDTVRLRVLFNSSAVSSNALTWYDLGNHSEKTGISDKLMISGTVYEYTDYSGNIKTADMYILSDKALFGNVLTNFGDNHIGIVNKNGGLIISDDDDFFNLLLKNNIETADKIYNTEEAVFEWKNGQDNIVSVYTSKLTDFKYINSSKVENFYKPVRSITKTAIIIAFVLVLIFLLLYMFIVRKITTPISEISGAMKNFDESSLAYRFPVKSNDEVGDIAVGFNKMMDSLNKMIYEVNERKDMQKDTEIKALSYQINPHFLYNAVGSIRIEAMKNNDERVADSLMNLSTILKSVFSNTNKYIKLFDELEISKSAVELLQLRYNKEISFKTVIPAECENCKIPSMVLQPILENSVLHGLSEKMRDDDFKAKIDVFVQLSGDDLIIRVIDNGIGISDEKIEKILTRDNVEKRGVGLYNVDERIKLLYGEDYGLSINSREGIYTEVVLKFKKI